MSRARYYQTGMKRDTVAAWDAGHDVVMTVLATGGGKTFVVGDTIKEIQLPTAAIAHRQELVGQISTALARENIRHDIIAPRNVIKAIVAAHMEEFGRSYYDPRSPVKVIGIDTFLNRFDDPEIVRWALSLGVGVIDEGHHVLRGNKWGQAIDFVSETKAKFGAVNSRTRWMLPTATPHRADGRGLGRTEGDGYVDLLVFGPDMRHLIDEGYLTDYRVFCPAIPPDLDLSNVPISDATGDLSQTKLRQAVHQSGTLVGDVVSHYIRHANGKLGVTFAVDVEAATEIAAAFRAAGVPAEVVSAKTPDDVRRSILRQFRNREILQLVNVDLFGEGFDLPAIEVVSMARPTESYSLYAQQFGRALRLMISPVLLAAWDTYTPEQRKRFIAESGKPKAIIIDHVGNIARHDLPDKPRPWSLRRRERRARLLPTDAIPLRICLNVTCVQPYERIFKCCPYCGQPAPEPVARTLEQVDGDLFELDPAILAAMRGEIARIDAPAPNLGGISEGAQRGAWRNHHARQTAQEALRHAMQCWSAVYIERGDDEATNYRRFFHSFGVDVLTAMALGTKDAGELHEKIEARLTREGYVIPERSIPQPKELAQ